MNRIQGMIKLVLLLSVTSASAQELSKNKRREMGNLTLQRIEMNIPKANSILKTDKVQMRNVGLVKPPSNSKFYTLDSDPLKNQYNSLLDEEIKKLYKLSEKYKRSPNRGEFWLRLGERYVEKARLVEFKLQDDYEQKLRAFQSGKTKVKPRPPRLDLAIDFNKKAIQLYEWYIRDYPTSNKVPQALFFLGYNNFEVGRVKQGEEYYLELTKKFPNSPYVTESYFALAEYHFEKERWKPALEFYSKVVDKKRSRLFGFALYKASWCEYRLTNYKTALALLERVIKTSRASGEDADDEGRKGIDRLRLGEEAIKDYVNFYEPTGKYKTAYEDFMEVTKSEKRSVEMLDALAYRYSYAGNLEASRSLFGQLIAMNPNAEKAAKYQYQIAADYGQTGRNKEFAHELAVWIDQFSKTSSWGQANAAKPQVIEENFNLQEATLRNHTLQLHQQAIKSRTDYANKIAGDAYKVYLSHFQGAKPYSEMRFFYGELLFDRKDYNAAAEQYRWVAMNDQKSKYFEQAVTNSVLAYEKGLPNDKKMDDVRKTLSNPMDKIPLSPEVQKFVEVSETYLKYFPKGDKAPEIRKRIGMLYYVHNQFDPTLNIMHGIIKDTPNSPDAPVAADIIMDIHRSRKDLVTYQKEGAELLKNQTIANSPFGKQLKLNLQEAKFLEANEYSKGGDFAKAGKAFEDFASLHPGSSKIGAAYVNAASNYEKGKKISDATRMYELILAKEGTDANSKQDARNSLANLYKKMGYLDKAAGYYFSYGANDKGPKGENAIFNAAVIWDALNKAQSASKAYDEFAKRGKKKDQMEATWLQALMLQRLKSNAQAVREYDKFLGLGPSQLDRIIKAHFEIGKMSHDQGAHAKAKVWFEKVVQLTSSSQGKKLGANYGAEAKYHLSVGILNQMKEVRLGNTEKSIMLGLKRLKDSQAQLTKEMAQVIKYDYGPMIVAALKSEGESFEVIANAFKTCPVPKEFNQPQVVQQFKELLQKESAGFYEKAKGSYRAGFDKGIAIKAYGEEVTAIAHNLYRLDPENFKQPGEIGMPSALIDRMGL